MTFKRKILEELEDWKHSLTRKPLIIRGARQVGKTTVVHTFAKSFRHYIYLNLERAKDQAHFDSYRDIQELEERIFLAHGISTEERKETLLFIDEIQEKPQVVNSLRYFKEELPDLAVIAAGSMLETLLDKNISFPVGRVEYKILRPVSFSEFLTATGKTLAAKELDSIPFNENAHNHLHHLFHRYALVGGMPEIVAKYSINNDITQLQKIYASLLQSYLDDAEKYAVSSAQLQQLRFVITKAISFAGKRITFQGFGNSNYKSREISELLRILQQTHLLHLLYPTTGTTLPVDENIKKAPRLQFLDTGLINFHVGLQSEILGTEQLDKVYQGLMIEHLVGQELLSFQFQPLKGLHFWVREKNTSSAEVDYVFPHKGQLIPIEVKSGTIGKIKSLQLFLDESPIHFGVRVYGGKLSIDQGTTQQGKAFYLLNLPYFLVSKIAEYIDWLQAEITRESNILHEPEVIYQKAPKPIKKSVPPTLETLKKEHHLLLAACAHTPQRGKTLLVEILGLSYQSHNKRKYLNPLVNLQLLEWTDQSHIKSKQQSYRLTEQGRAYLSGIEKGAN